VVGPDGVSITPRSMSTTGRGMPCSSSMANSGSP
jgi:hypothetical protein